MKPPELVPVSSLPPAVRSLASAQTPLECWAKGSLPRGPCVAVIGTRRPSTEADRFTRELCRSLAKRGVCVISGGAVGIDAAAHEGALDGGGRTVAVLPCGPEALHPKENADLLDRIAEADGALLWPFPWGTRADRPRFFFRNAVMVALSHAVVITAAGVPSGALNAAKHARALGVPRFVVVGPPWEGRLRGGLSELARGATAIESVGSLLRELSRRAIAPPLGSLLTSSSSR